MKKILKLLDDNEKNKVVLIIFLLVFLGICEALTFFFLQPIFNYFSNNEYNFKIPYLSNFFDINLNISILFFLFIFFFTSRVFLLIIASYYRTKLVKNINDSLSNKIYSYYIFKDFQFFINNNNSKFITNITDEVEKFSYRVIDSLIGLITEIFLITGVLVFLFIMFFYVSILLFLISIFFFLIIYNLYKYKFRDIGNVKLRSDAGKIDILYNSFHIIQNIKLDNLESFFIKDFKEKTQASSRSQFLISFFNDLPKPILEFSLLFLVLALIYIAHFYLNINKQGIFSILAIYGISMFRILPSLNRIIGYLNLLKFYYPTTEVISDIIKNSDVSKNNILDKKKFLDFKKSIRIKNLSFKYDKSDFYTLNNVNLEININDIIGISGESGSGKSTLLNILCSLLKPSSGQIFIDDEPLENIHRSFQSRVGYVSQKIYLTYGNFVENIIMNKTMKNYDPEMFGRVLDICGLTSFINNLPDKEKTLIGEKGARLSGGQQQRLCIARALYKNPNILILDEATNALDEKSEKEILQLILNLKKFITIILVSHKKETLEICDKIYQIKNSQINQIK
jgi:ABC-type bacteriocin/lantibiotic exporter with double-glycine peptidase domain